MKHFATHRFWASYRSLPPAVQRLADEKFVVLKSDPRHPSLHLKKIGRFWSSRVGLHYRVLAVDGPDGSIVWFWIGTHADYDKLVG